MTLHRSAWRLVEVLVPAFGRRTDQDRTGPSLAVVGNCQAREIARALRLLAPDSPVTYLPTATLGRRFGNAARLADALSAFDHVYSQEIPHGLIAGGGDLLFRLVPHLVRVPTIVFPAFHPDMVYAGPSSRLARSPLGQYHSAIALFAHRLGLDAARTVTLYRRDVFERLGYLRGWDVAAADLVATSAALGFGLEEDLARWARRGAFMHGLNHPRLFVFGDLARRLLRRSGLAPAPVAVEDYIPDDLADDVIWPVYPDIAELYGLDGSFLFKDRARSGAAPALYDLPGFVAASFALYDGQGRDALSCERVDAWLGMPPVRSLFEDARA